MAIAWGVKGESTLMKQAERPPLQQEQQEVSHPVTGISPIFVGIIIEHIRMHCTALMISVHRQVTMY